MRKVWEGSGESVAITGMPGTLLSPHEPPLCARGQMGTQGERASGQAQAPHAQGTEVQAASI